MKVINKVINIGKVLIGSRRYNNFCKIEFDGKRLSITGVTGPTKHGNSYGSAGQCVSDVERIDTFSSGWTKDLRDKFVEIWNTWHLNDMTPGSPKQMKALNDAGLRDTDYTTQCEYLKKVGLYEDSTYEYNGKPYKYGHAWLTCEVPSDVVEFLLGLPNTTITPHWV